MNNALLWMLAVTTFFIGFALGVVVMLVHFAVSRKLTVPKELMPTKVEVPPPRAANFTGGGSGSVGGDGGGSFAIASGGVGGSASPYVPKPKKDRTVDPLNQQFSGTTMRPEPTTRKLPSITWSKE